MAARLSSLFILNSKQKAPCPKDPLVKLPPGFSDRCEKRNVAIAIILLCTWRRVRQNVWGPHETFSATDCVCHKHARWRAAKLTTSPALKFRGPQSTFHRYEKRNVAIAIILPCTWRRVRQNVWGTPREVFRCRLRLSQTC